MNDEPKCNVPKYWEKREEDILEKYIDPEFHMETHEEFMARMMKRVNDFLHVGVDNGWWESVDDVKNDPIPHPKIIKISELAQHERTWAHVFFKLKLFASISEARKNGFTQGSITDKLIGKVFEFKKKTIRIKIEE